MSPWQPFTALQDPTLSFSPHLIWPPHSLSLSLFLAHHLQQLTSIKYWWRYLAPRTRFPPLCLQSPRLSCLTFLTCHVIYNESPSFTFTLFPVLLVLHFFHLSLFLNCSQRGSRRLQLVELEPFHTSRSTAFTSMMFQDTTLLPPPSSSSSSSMLLCPRILFFRTAFFSPCLFGPPLGWLLLAAPVPPTLSLDVLFIGPQRGWLSVQGVCCLKQHSLNKKGRSSLWFVCFLSVFVNRR